MTCAVCVDGPGKEYHLHLSGRDGSVRDVALELCEGCVQELLTEEWIETRGEPASHD